MTDSNNNRLAPNKSPSHFAYHIRARKNAKGFWTRIGSAFAHADGKGFTIITVNGEITLRVPSGKKA
jgi:hypothetical protein